VGGAENPNKGTDNPNKANDNPNKANDNPNKANDNPNKATDDAGRKRSDRDQHCAFGRVGSTLLEALDLNVERSAVCLQLLQSTQRCLVRA
jgi:hypothetical protein